MSAGAAEQIPRETARGDLLYPYVFEYLWHLGRLRGYATSRELAGVYGTVHDWRRGNGRAAANTLRSLAAKGLVQYGDGVWELTPKGWEVVAP